MCGAVKAKKEVHIGMKGANGEVRAGIVCAGAEVLSKQDEY